MKFSLKSACILIISIIVIAGYISCTLENENPGSTVSVTDVNIVQDSISISEISSQQLDWVVSPDDATNTSVTWESSDTDVATVTNGLVTGSGEGTAVITVTTVDGNHNDTCAVTVTAFVPVTGIDISQTEEDIDIGYTVQLNTVFAPTNASNQNITWISSNNAIATVSDGEVLGIAEGTVTITATAEDTSAGTFSDTCTINVHLVAATGVALNETTADIYIGGELQLAASVSPTNASNKNVIWSSNNTSVATVVDGLISTHETGSAVITVETEDGGYQATCTVTVDPIDMTLYDFDWSTDGYQAIPMGQHPNLNYLEIEFDPVSAPDQEITIDIANESVVTVYNIDSDTGYKDIFLSPESVGTTTLTVTSQADTSLSRSITIEVTADVTAPYIEQASVLGPDYIVIEIDEVMSTTGLTTAANYSVISDPSGSATTLAIDHVTYNIFDKITEILIYTSDDLPQGEISGTISNIEDASGNVISASGNTFSTYVTPDNGCTVDTDYVTINSGVVDCSAGAVSLPGFPWISSTGGFSIYVVETGQPFSGSTAIASGELNSDGSLYDGLASSDTYEEMVFSPGTYDFYVVGAYDIDGDPLTSDYATGVSHQCISIVIP